VMWKERSKEVMLFIWTGKDGFKRVITHFADQLTSKRNYKGMDRLHCIAWLAALMLSIRLEVSLPSPDELIGWEICNTSES
jgi:hypothetical protein